MKPYILGVICGAIVVAQLSCVRNQDRPVQRRVAAVEREPDRPQVPSDRYLAHFAPTPGFLPRWKTEWEQRIERQRFGEDGVFQPDQYDDYRTVNITNFYITQPPTTAGIRPPAEYEPSQAYLLHWDQDNQTAWKKLFGEIVKGAWGIVPVLMIYNDATHKSWIEGQLANLGYSAAEMQDPQNIIWWQHKSNAIWARDYGPVSIVDSPTSGSPTLSFVDFRYYHNRIYDDEIPADLAQDWGINDFRPDLSYEGGNFMSTSDGLCAATKGVLYDNPQLSQSAVEQIFSDYLGCKKSVFTATMKGGVIKHIDMYAKLASDTSVLVGEYEASQDATNKAILDANAQLLASTTTPSGKSISVTRIPMPDHTGAFGLPVWRTYTNSLSLVGSTGKVVLIPVYSDEPTYEQAALAAYAQVYPGWTLVPIDSDVIIPLQGAIHCITMQVPVATQAKMETDPPDLCGAGSYSCFPAVCGAIPAEGCCEDGMLKYCSSGKIKYDDCADEPSCGWSSAKSQYECGTSGTPDPSGLFSMSCNVVKDAGVPDQGPLPDQAVDPCGKITYQGCCDGQTLKFCQNNQLKELDCSSSLSCGWSEGAGLYDCGTDGNADPSGTYPLLCPGALPDAGSDAAADLGPDHSTADSAPATDGPASDQGPATDGSKKDDGGCGCALAARPAPRPALSLLGLLLLGLALTRQRPR